MPPELLSIDETAALCGCHRATIRRGWYDGTFPKPIRIGRRAIRWRRSDVQQWLQAQPILIPPPERQETLT